MGALEKGEVYLVSGRMLVMKPGDKEGVFTVVETPTLIPELKGKNIKALCCGEDFTVAMTGKTLSQNISINTHLKLFIDQYLFYNVFLFF
jgi:hypothetical protein